MPMNSFNQSKWPEKADFPIARPGLRYVVLACIAAGLLFFAGFTVAAWIVVFVACFVCWFFRDPDRKIPDQPDAIVSPADGKVIRINTLEDNAYTNAPCIKISIFMNVFNVHVNRVPYGGIVEDVAYHEGKFFNASFDKASELNERNGLTVKTDTGFRYAVVQIAGLVARRIVCSVMPGDVLKRGSRYGMICFGSRLDLYLPPDTTVGVSIGQKVTAGSTIIGTIPQEK